MNTITKITREWKGRLLAGALLVGLAALATAGSYYGGPTPLINSQYGSPLTATNGSAQWGTNTPTGNWGTNGLYPSYIVGGTTTVSNAVLLSSIGSGNYFALQMTAQLGGTAATMAAGNTTNNVIATLLETVGTPTIVKTNLQGYTISTSTPIGTFASVSLPLGYTSGTYSSTNVLYTPYSTPAYASPMQVWLLSLGTVGMTNTAWVTNYQIIPLVQ